MPRVPDGPEDLSSSERCLGGVLTGFGERDEHPHLVERWTRLAASSIQNGPGHPSVEPRQPFRVRRRGPSHLGAGMTTATQRRENRRGVPVSPEPDEPIIRRYQAMVTHSCRLRSLLPRNPTDA